MLFSYLICNDKRLKSTQINYVHFEGKVRVNMRKFQPDSHDTVHLNTA